MDLRQREPESPNTDIIGMPLHSVADARARAARRASRCFAVASRHVLGLAFLCVGPAVVPAVLTAQPVMPRAAVTSRPSAAHEARPTAHRASLAPHAPAAPERPPLLPTAEEWPLLILMPFTGALGAHVLGSPQGWDRTWDGYGNRLGDQVGFLVIEEGVRRVLTRALPPTAPRASCWQTERRAVTNLTVGSGCALWSTVAVRPASGNGWRFNAPVTVSLLAATGTSLAWRPERADAATARSFLLTRTAIVFGGMAAARLFDDWRSRGTTLEATP
jgi:hypothetical protein